MGYNRRFDHNLAGSDVEEIYAKGAVPVDPSIGKAGYVDTAVVTITLQTFAFTRGFLTRA